MPCAPTPRRPIAPPALLLWLASMLCAQGGFAQDAIIERSRALTEEFAHRLQTELTRALAEGGPAQAVRVCKDVAPQVASELSRRSGAQIARTSLRLRNPLNAPAPWQMSVLREFEARAERGEAAATLEHFSEATETGQLRYMKAIPAGALCLTCHGSELPEPLAAALAEHYPFDRATGYRAGDIRGAFSVVWPADAY